MYLKNDSWVKGRMIGEFTKEEFNTVMSTIEDVSSFYKDEENESEEGPSTIKGCDMIRNQLIKYSHFDVENGVVKVSFFPRELGMLLGLMVSLTIPRNEMDFFGKLISEGEVNIWEG